VIKKTVIPQIEKCNYLIEPYIAKNIGVLDFSETHFLFKLGYDETIKLIEQHLKK